LLEKAEKEIEDKKAHIAVLEKIIKDGGLGLPEDIQGRISTVI
jgi:hypothetical protein